MVQTPLTAVFIGSDTLLLQCADTWLQRGHEIRAIATDAEKVRRFAAERGLRCITVDDAQDLTAALAADAFDYLFAVTWLRMLPAELLRLPRRQAINFHDGPLPRYAGLNATCWAIYNGETGHGVTWHAIEPTADTGAILRQETFAIAPDDTALTLNARCFQAGLETFAALADDLQNGQACLVEQDLTQRTCFLGAQRPARLGVLDLHAPAADCARVIRALDHGGYRNPVTAAKLWLGTALVVPGGVEVVAATGSPPGTITRLDDDVVQIAARDGDLALRALRALDGAPLDRPALTALGVTIGAVLPALDAGAVAELDGLAAITGRGEPRWLAELTRYTPLPVPGGAPAGAHATPANRTVQLPVNVTSTATGDIRALAVAALTCTFLARKTATASFDVGLHLPAGDTDAARAAGFDAPPVHLEIDFTAPVGEAAKAAADALAVARARGPLLREVVLRHPEQLRAGARLEPPVRVAVGTAPPVAPGTLTFQVDDAGGLTIRYDAGALPAATVDRLVEQLQRFLANAIDAPATPLAEVPLLDAAELQRLLTHGAPLKAPLPDEPLLHRRFAAQAAATPDRVALRCGDRSLRYDELADRVEALAAELQARGASPGDRVGICAGRGIDLVVAVLAVLRTGAAYVPLDPGYPEDRLQFMADDAGLTLLVTDRDSAGSAPTTSAPSVVLETALAGAAAPPAAAANGHGDDAAYVIYTSGSTGKPKGVVVRHRNVANFFAGMDDVLGHVEGAEPGTWLAVTSLSFDISVLELLWTLCRGFTVIVHKGEGHAAQAAAATAAAHDRPLTFSLFYFASDEGENSRDKYRLLLDGARFADAHGFEAVWTPERHFHAFGGLYPNSAVASAALAAVTERVQIRAGSVVSPLHSPIRIAEDWALVDNLSGGRVGVSFAAGWQPNDFVLSPQNFADRKAQMFRDIDTVHRLWRGETVQFPGHDGAPVAVRTLPRPVQPSLPTWVTIAGNPETYRQAGETGSFVLTHLLGQSLGELRDKLRIYREAWQQAGHPGAPRVSLMLHTFLGADEQQVRATVKEPLKDYLRSSVDLIRQAAWSFPAFKQRTDGSKAQMDALLQGGIPEDEMDALLDFAFERYYDTSGLFGTPDGCQAMLDELRAVGVDEVACLVDFGIPSDVVLASLPHLLAAKQRSDARVPPDGRPTAPVAVTEDAPGTDRPLTVAQQIERHGVTHFQCTPSMAAMLLVDPDTAPAFARLQYMLVGGEALPTALARQLGELVGSVHNMYGPTETTVWSTSWQVDGDDPVPIGRPLRNQQVYLLDRNLQLVPEGEVGELWIGGAGVTAGYHRRAELDAERFVTDPFADTPDARMYRTGDLARWRSDGVLEFLGRVDHQVKIRGYRIELGEIETVLGQRAEVREVVVTARTDDGGTRLCAYVVPEGPSLDLDALRRHVRDALPEFMVPQFFVTMPDLPRTPNQKVDRKALPAPEDAARAAARERIAAADDTEATVLSIWQLALGTTDIGVEDSFFDSGGHSILAVQVHHLLQDRLEVKLQITDLFRFPTVRSLSRHLRQARSGTVEKTAAQLASERAQARRQMLRRS